MEAEVDVERHAEVQDDVPGQDAVEAEVEGHHDGLADLEERDHPQGQVAHQKERHNGPPWLALHLPTHTHTVVFSTQQWGLVVACLVVSI